MQETFRIDAQGANVVRWLGRHSHGGDRATSERADGFLGICDGAAKRGLAFGAEKAVLVV